MRGSIVLTAVLLATLGGAASASEVVPGASQRLQACLKKADEFPDIGAATAQAWIKKDGGDEAHLCRAFAQANRGMHADAAREFWGLASRFDKAGKATGKAAKTGKADKADKGRALLMHTMSGREFLRAKDFANAEARFAAALKISPGHADALTGRAQCRMAVEKYWDALADLNLALKAEPDNVEVLRQRGRAWLALGNDRNAKEDFAHAHAVDGGAKP